MSITITGGGSDGQFSNDGIRPRKVKNLVDQLTDRVAVLKGAMFDYCIKRGMEIAIPDLGMRAMYLEQARPIPGLECTVSYQNVPEHCERLTVSYMKKELVKAVIRSTVFSDRVEVKMQDFWCIDGNNSHIYVD